MKLSITNPEVLDTLVDFAGGLWPIRRGGDSRMILVVKTLRETAQTAKLRGAFRFYLVPVNVGGVATYGLVTAFFDDSDEPLTISTPLFNEEITRDFLLLLSSDSFYVHFFDEHNRELLGLRAENPDAHRFRSLSHTIPFVSPSLARARQCLDEMGFWFSARSPSDDDAAFIIHLRERMFPDSLEEHVDNPGDFKEPDIATALNRAFMDAQVFSNPIRADNGREFVDVLVETPKTLLLIQAKDSPDTESALTRKIVRKQATAAKHISKASGQLKGSINHLRSGESIEIIVNGKRRDLAMSGRDVFGIVIVKEVFDPERPVCSQLVLTVFEETDIPCLLLDYVEFHLLTFFRPTEESLVRTLSEVFLAACEHGMFPRSRFGLRAGRTVVYEPRETGNALHSAAYEPVRSVADKRQDTTAPPSMDLATGDAARMGFREGLCADVFRVVVDRIEVEALDVSHTASLLSRVLADRNAVERHRGRVDLAFYGYSSDPRELYEIPEVRRFCAQLDDAFPYWFYFLSTEGVTLMVIACCLCLVTKLREGLVSFGPDLVAFLTRHFEALNWIFENYSLDERHNIEISGRIIDYFRISEPTRSPNPGSVAENGGLAP